MDKEMLKELDLQEVEKKLSGLSEDEMLQIIAKKHDLFMNLVKDVRQRGRLCKECDASIAESLAKKYHFARLGNVWVAMAINVISKDHWLWQIPPSIQSFVEKLNAKHLTQAKLTN